MLSKETKVGVKNKENKTACFIEMEGLLNSPELIMICQGGKGRAAGPGWRVGEAGWGREVSRSGLRSRTGCKDRGDVVVFRGGVSSSFSAPQIRADYGGGWGEGFGTLASLLAKSCFWTLSVCHHPHQPLGRSPVPSLPTSQGWAEAKWHPADSQKLPARPSHLSQGAPKNSALSSWYPLPLPKEW